ncbi:MAG: TniQ family protein, partial [Loktanella sp.]|nr:TniQ family protein [Loktanella sp.]
MTQLFPHFPFDPIETPQSYAARLAWLHTGGALLPFLQDIGIKPADLMGNEAGVITAFAEITGEDMSVLSQNAAVRVAKRTYDLRGSQVSAEFMARPATVFCPACLAEDDVVSGVPGLRRGRWIWTLSVVRTCPEHGLPLIARAKANWSDELNILSDRVPEFGEGLQYLIDDRQARTVSPLQNYIVARLSGERGPEWLDSQTLEQAWRATEMLGMVAEFGPNKNLKTATRDEWDAAGRTGFEFTAQGRAGILEGLEQIFQVRSRPLKNAGPQKVFGRLFQWLAFAKGSKDPGEIREIIRNYIFDHFALASGHKVFGVALTERQLHTAPSLATESGLDVRTLRSVLIARKLVPVDDEQAQVAFDAEAGRKVARSITRLVTGIGLPKVLGCTRPQAEQLVDEGLLTPIVDEFLEGHGRVRKAFDAEQVAEFLENLLSATRTVATIADDLVPISKAAERAKISSAEILHLILGYHLKTVVRISDSEGIASIFVDSDEVKGCAKTLLIGLTISGAAGCLKMPRQSVAMLASEYPHVLVPTIVAAEQGAHQFVRFMEQDVHHFRENYTTAVRVANTHGVEAKVVLGRLKRAGVKPIFHRASIGISIY